jgi:hypothetical protein
VTGRCLCGGVRFEVDADTQRMRFCHCTSCKKLSGSGGTANVRVRSNEIRILDGRELLTTYQPSEGSAKTFCSRCGSNMFGGGWPDSEFCSVRVTTLDEQPQPVDTQHLFVESVASWEEGPPTR